ncbi:TetR family transcriptional regulator [Gemmatimonadetes bacterium T265]|nr:TetR family transcriptional regulator [Gemmatimonadetes bacterium T265]
MSSHRGRSSQTATAGRDGTPTDGGRSFALFWAARDRSPRGPKPALTLDAVVQAAIALADAEGLGALTMSRVATRLGVTPMALYRYVPGKEDLVDLMTDAARGAPPAAEGDAWRLEITRWARASLALFARRPWLLKSAQRRVPIGPRWLDWLEAGLRALAASGLPPDELVAAVMLVDGHVRATAQLAVGAAGTERWSHDFARVLHAVRGDTRYPALTRVADAGGFDVAASATSSAFEFGLRRVLDGIAASPPAPSPASPDRSAG